MKVVGFRAADESKYSHTSQFLVIITTFFLRADLTTCQCSPQDLLHDCQRGLRCSLLPVNDALILESKLLITSTETYYYNYGTIGDLHLSDLDETYI